MNPLRACVQEAKGKGYEALEAGDHDPLGVSQVAAYWQSRPQGVQMQVNIDHMRPGEDPEDSSKHEMPTATTVEDRLNS